MTAERTPDRAAQGDGLEDTVYRALNARLGEPDQGSGTNSKRWDLAFDLAAAVRAHYADQAAAIEMSFIEALAAEARKYAVNRKTPAGPPIWSLTLAQLPEVALTALRAALRGADS